MNAAVARVVHIRVCRSASDAAAIGASSRGAAGEGHEAVGCGTPGTIAARLLLLLLLLLLLRIGLGTTATGAPAIPAACSPAGAQLNAVFVHRWLGGKES